MVHVVCPPRILLLPGLHPQPIADVDTADEQNPVVLVDVALDLADQQILSSRYPARLQRASEGTRQSATGRRYDVVERGRDGRVGVNAVVLRDLSVDAEAHRFWRGG